MYHTLEGGVKILGTNIFDLTFEVLDTKQKHLSNLEHTTSFSGYVDYYKKKTYIE